MAKTQEANFQNALEQLKADTPVSKSLVEQLEFLKEQISFYVDGVGSLIAASKQSRNKELSDMLIGHVKNLIVEHSKMEPTESKKSKPNEKKSKSTDNHKPEPVENGGGKNGEQVESSKPEPMEQESNNSVPETNGVTAGKGKKRAGKKAKQEEEAPVAEPEPVPIVEEKEKSKGTRASSRRVKK